MRHSSLQLTGQYREARAVDIDAAASQIFCPRLNRIGMSPTPLAATGTDGKPISRRFSLHLPYEGDGSVRTESGADVITDSNALAIRMGLSLENSAPDVPGRLEMVAVDQKAPPGFEPGMKVLQTSALPLGYGARKQRGEREFLAWLPSRPRQENRL